MGAIYVIPKEKVKKISNIGKPRLSRALLGTCLMGLLLPVMAQQPASVPTSGNNCNGTYSGTFNGDVNVSAGQTCIFMGGG